MTITYRVLFDRKPLEGYSLQYMQKDSGIYPQIELVTDGWRITRTVTGAFRMALMAPYPHREQNFTAILYFKKAGNASCGIVAAASDNKFYYALYNSYRSTLQIVEHSIGSNPTILAETSDTYTIEDNVQYHIRVEVYADETDITISAKLLDEQGTVLLEVAYTIAREGGVEPVAGIAVATPVDTEVVLCEFLVTYSGDPNIPWSYILSPDQPDFDWIGAPKTVYFEHSDGKFYPWDEDGKVWVTIRTHDEAGDAGKEVWLYRIDGDPRVRSNWVKVEKLLDREDLGWSVLEESILVKFKDGTEKLFIAGGAGTYYLYRLRRTETGWEVEKQWDDRYEPVGVTFDGKFIYKREGGASAAGTNEFYVSDDWGDTAQEIGEILTNPRKVSMKELKDKYVLIYSTVHESVDNLAENSTIRKAYFTKDWQLLSDEELAVQYRVPHTIYRTIAAYIDLIPWNGNYYICCEGYDIDHDTDDDINDQRQRHVIVYNEPQDEVYNPAQRIIRVITKLRRKT